MSHRQAVAAISVAVHHSMMANTPPLNCRTFSRPVAAIADAFKIAAIQPRRFATGSNGPPSAGSLIIVNQAGISTARLQAAANPISTKIGC